MTPERRRVVEALKVLLADSYVVYLKTHGFHWNVTGPMFTTLHNLFMTQYGELALAVDEIAERIRALGEPAPGSYQEFAALANVREASGVPCASEMIETLAADQAAIADAARDVIQAAEAAGDDASGDLGVRRIDVHEKNAWMLRAHLE